MAFRDVAATWLITLCEPLIPTFNRVVADEAFVAQTQRDFARSAWWFGGVIADHMMTLPSADPWRHLSATVEGVMARGMVPKPPARTGAVGRNGVFGTVADGQDLVPPSFTDAATDVGLAALVSGISPGGAALVAFGTDGWDAAGRAALAVHAHHLAVTRDPGVAAAQFFGDASDALLWAIWRRRAYLGLADDWTLVSGFAWLGRAEELAATGQLPAGEADQVRRAVVAEAIDPGTYELFSANDT